MRGFLHRVVTSVLLPRPSLHPIVAPKFAPVSSVGMETEASQASARAAARTESTHPQTVNAPAAPVFYTGASPGIDGAKAFQSLMPHARADVPVQAGSVDRNMSGEADEVDSSPGEGHPATAADGIGFGSAAEAVRIASEFVPLIAKQEWDGDSSSEDKQPGAIEQTMLQEPIHVDTWKAELARLNERRLSQAQAIAAQSVPAPAEDIQIHIGRIEVIAVPQAASRAAAAAPRRGLSLEEYLSRRNGRSG